MPEVESEYVMTVTVTVDALHDVGEAPPGIRHIDSLREGQFEGPCFKDAALKNGLD